MKLFLVTQHSPDGQSPGVQTFQVFQGPQGQGLDQQFQVFSGNYIQTIDQIVDMADGPIVTSSTKEELTAQQIALLDGYS